MAKSGSQALSSGSTWIKLYDQTVDGPPSKVRGFHVKNLSTSGGSAVIFCAPLHGDVAAASGDISATGITLEAGDSINLTSFLPSGAGGRIDQVWAKSADATVTFGILMS